MEWKYDKLKTLQIQQLTINLEFDVPLLSNYLRKKLNPLQLTVLGFKDVPAKTGPEYKPIYSSVQFVDGTEYKTHEVPQSSTCKFNHQHVYLVGRFDAAQIKELFATKLIKIYLHDSDEYNSEPEKVFGKGQASFTFRDFLRPNCKELKLRSDVFPTKRTPEDTTKQLDLNTTAKK